MAAFISESDGQNPSPEVVITLGTGRAGRGVAGTREAALPQAHRRSSSSRPRVGSLLAFASRYISGTTSRDHESCPATWPTPGAIAVHFWLIGLDQ